MINKYFPELDYYFTNYWTNYAEITTDFISSSSIVGYIPTTKSIFRLLFDDSFNESEYFYLFDILNKSSLPNSVKDRLNYVSRPTQIYTSKTGIDLNNDNILNFNLNDVQLFDALYQYRMGNLIDLNLINFSNLDTNLSRMIYIYLDLKLNKNFDKLNNNFLVSDSTNLLETLFEVYLINESHKTIKKLNFL